MNSPFVLSTNVCVSQNMLGSETLLFVLPVMCCSWKSRGSLIESKPETEISLKGWSLIGLGTCVE